MTIKPLLCDTKEAAILLRIEEKTISNNLYNKTFPIPKVKVGGATRFRISDILQFVATGKPVLHTAALDTRDPYTVDLISGTTDAENKPRRGCPRKIVSAVKGGTK